jgi:hypothetical protein
MVIKPLCTEIHGNKKHDLAHVYALMSNNKILINSKFIKEGKKMKNVKPAILSFVLISVLIIGASLASARGSGRSNSKGDRRD